jgi:hypothetical protein
MLAMRQIAVGNQPVFSQPSALPWGVYYHRFAIQYPTIAFISGNSPGFGTSSAFGTASVVPCGASVQHLEAGALRMNPGQDPQDRKELATFLLLNVTA